MYLLLYVSGNDCVDINGNAIDESPSPTSSCYDKDQHSEEKEPEPGSSTETATHPTSSSVNEQSQSSKDYISMPNEKSYGPWNFKQCKTNVEDLFENKAVHSFFTCKDADCSTIHTDSQIFKKFKHSWLNSKNWWLCFVENDGMFCLVCKKHQMKHPQNQRSVFASTPSVRFKIDSLNTHVQSKLHIAALQNELLQQVSVFHQEVIKKTEVNNTVLNQVFSSAYFLMKEFVANKKLLPLLQFIEKIFEVEHLKFFQHRSARSQTEIFRTLGDVMKEIMLENVRKSNAFGLMTDEVADISVKENLVTFIQYYSFKDEETKTNFLSCKDILEKHNAANAETITGLLLEELESDKLDVSKLTGFSSDGASVMVGKRTGVATRLREKNPCLINIHCVCHKLALSCADSNESISFIKNMEIILRQLWQLFENSPKKMAIYLKTQKELKNITMGDKAQKVVSKRLKKACRTRWLSLESSVKAVFSEYEVILHTLSKLEKDDAAACGLLKKMKGLKFLGAIYILNDILPILADLSRLFQKDSLNFSVICPAINMTKDKLKQLIEEDKPIESLRNDIDSFTNMCAEINLTKKDSDELTSLFKKYVDALIKNIDRRFEDCGEVLSSFAIFDPTLLPKTDETGFKEYGEDSIKVLGEHFYQDDEEKKNQKAEKLLTEWQGLKYQINDNLKKIMPQDVKDGKSKITATEWLLNQLVRNKSFCNFYPSIVFIAEVALALPVSNAWPERGASALKNVKTKQRNRLTSHMLDSILHVCINGPPVESLEGEALIKRAVTTWTGAKNRRRLPANRAPTSKVQENTMTCKAPVLEDASVQTETPTEIVTIETEVRQTLNEVRNAMKILELDEMDNLSEDDCSSSDDLD